MTQYLAFGVVYSKPLHQPFEPSIVPSIV